MNTRYFSSLSPKQKDKTSKKICEILADLKPLQFIKPQLWGVLFDVSFDEIIATKNEADKYCYGMCIKLNGVWLPVSLKELSK